jgi:hypothetical protein
VVWYCLLFHGFVCFHFLCAEFLGESFVVVAWWSYIILVSAYHERLVLSVLIDSFAAYSILGLKLFLFSAGKTSLHALFVFNVSLRNLL